MGGSEPPHQWENLFGIIFLQFVGHPPGRRGVNQHELRKFSIYLEGCHVKPLDQLSSDSTQIN